MFIFAYIWLNHFVDTILGGSSQSDVTVLVVVLISVNKVRKTRSVSALSEGMVTRWMEYSLNTEKS